MKEKLSVAYMKSFPKMHQQSLSKSSTVAYKWVTAKQFADERVAYNKRVAYRSLLITKLLIEKCTPFRSYYIFFSEHSLLLLSFP